VIWWINARLDGTHWANFPGDEPNFLENRLKDCVQNLDYRYLNDVIGIPTDENLARYINSPLVDIPSVDIPGVDTVGVQSTDDAGVDLGSTETRVARTVMGQHL